jgi:hypothetical protein
MRLKGTYSFVPIYCKRPRPLRQFYNSVEPECRGKLEFKG